MEVKEEVGGNRLKRLSRAESKPMVISVAGYSTTSAEKEATAKRCEGRVW